MKGEKSHTADGLGKGKASAEEGKMSSCRTRIGMDFDPKISKLHNQNDVDKYLAQYGFRLNPGIKIEFCPHGVDISLDPPGERVYMHP